MNSLSINNEARFHHVGFVVASILKVATEFAQTLRATWNGEITYDALQEVRVTFMYVGLPQNPAIELVEPAGEGSHLQLFLEHQGGLHHVCYEVDSLESHLTYCRSHGCIVVKQPLPAVAFGGRRIAWVYTSQQLLLEYLER